jgi:5-methylcytosine-specific restriction endonuclease McrA
MRVIQQLKESKPCLDCGNYFPYYVMDFDHRNPAEKHITVNELVRRMPSIDRVLAEIAKCDLICANCHRVRTFKQNTAVRNGAATWDKNTSSDRHVSRDNKRTSVRGINVIRNVDG